MSKSTKASEPRSNPDSDAIVDLATGQLSFLDRWKVRRRVAKSQEHQRELKETESLFAELRDLKTVPVTRSSPDWENARNNIADPFFPRSFGGLLMNRRTVFVATAVLSLLCITGGYAAVKYFYTPFQDMNAGNGLVWHADHAFSGQVKFYSPDGVYRGSNGTDGEEGAPVAATITVSGQSFSVTGAGRHPLLDPSGKLLGTAELVPETQAQRAAWRVEHDKQNGIEQPLHMNYGAVDGYGQCIGFFGDGATRIDWKLSGSNVRVRFFDTQTGRQVYSAGALAVNDAIRADLKRSLSPESYAATVASTVPPEPQFTWQTPGGEEHTWKGSGAELLKLSNGINLRVELVPQEEK